MLLIVNRTLANIKTFIFVQNICNMEGDKIKIMISSSVYGFEVEIKQIATLLRTLGYEVMNSYCNTIPVSPKKSNLENCIDAVEKCDLFLGFIRTNCGTGNIGDKNITFEEFKKAIELDKPYWFMVEKDVVFGRRLFRNGIKIKDDSKKNIWDVIDVDKKGELCRV